MSKSLIHVEHFRRAAIAIPAASTNFPLQIKGIFFPAKAAYGWIRPDSSRLRQLDGSLPVCELNARHRHTVRAQERGAP